MFLKKAMDKILEEKRSSMEFYLFPASVLAQTVEEIQSTRAHGADKKKNQGKDEHEVYNKIFMSFFIDSHRRMLYYIYKR